MPKQRYPTDRPKLLKIVGGRYARHQWAFDLGKCIYCGDIEQEVDHVPAVSWLYALGTGYFQDKGIPVVTVPACRWCNAALSSKGIHTIKLRKEFIAEKLKKRFKNINSSARWTEEEIEEMGYTFQGPLTNREDLRRFALRRIEWAETILPWDLCDDAKEV